MAGSFLHRVGIAQGVDDVHLLSGPELAQLADAFADHLDVKTDDPVLVIHIQEGERPSEENVLGFRDLYLGEIARQDRRDLHGRPQVKEMVSFHRGLHPDHFMVFNDLVHACI